MLRGSDDVEFDEVGTHDELESLNRSGLSNVGSILDISKVREHLREHHDLPSSTTKCRMSSSSSLWPSTVASSSSSSLSSRSPSIATRPSPADDAKHHPPLFLVKLPPRCSSDRFSRSSKPSSILSTHDPLGLSSTTTRPTRPPSLTSPSPRPRSVGTGATRPARLSSFTTMDPITTSANRGDDTRRASAVAASGTNLVCRQPSPTSGCSSQSSFSFSSSSTPVGSHNASGDFSSGEPISLISPTSQAESSSFPSSVTNLPYSTRTAPPRGAMHTTPHSNPLPRAHSDTNVCSSSSRKRSLSCEMASTSSATSSSSSSRRTTLTQRRPRSCHTSPQMELTLMDEYFLERIGTHVSLLEKMRERCVHEDGLGTGPVIAVTNWQHAEDYPPVWVSKLKELITDPRFPEPLYLETDEDADDDVVEGVLMSLIRNEDLCDIETEEKRRLKARSAYRHAKSPYHLCYGRLGSLGALFILLVLIVWISRWYAHTRDVAPGVGGAPGGGGGGGAPGGAGAPGGSAVHEYHVHGDGGGDGLFVDDGEH